MAKLATLIFASLLVVSSTAGLPEDGKKQWNIYKLKFNKSYASQGEDELRRQIFLGNKAMIEEFNAVQSANLGYVLGLNQLADYTASEMDRLKGLKLFDRAQIRTNSQSQEFLDAIFDDNSIEIPDEVDWRQVPGRVSGVKNQGVCGSCWAFSATGALEGQEAIRNKSLLYEGQVIGLSEQNLIDCDRETDKGCDGGYMSYAFEFIKKEGGIDDDVSYEYEGKNGHCRFKKDRVAMTDSGSAILPEGDEQKLKETVAKFGPVSVGIDARAPFQFYKGGVMDDPDCSNKSERLNHGVLVVGYGVDKEYGDFWIVKNSWGDMWGVDGYIKMSRNKNNQCGIATAAVIPTF